tara:strand:- start:1496 stop:2062 length:567 start_codon:yes stop_codon:yes gene_type:complete
MKKIGITGSLASGKTTASKILARKKFPLFSADNEVKKLYKKKNFLDLISNKFKLKNNNKTKQIIKKIILDDKMSLKKLEKIIHPFVRREMRRFERKNKGKRFVFFEIPLLVESNLMNKFDIVIFIKAKKSLRFKRFVSKGGNKKLFQILNKKQLSDSRKEKHSDFVVVNEKNKIFLKKRLLDILKNYD